MKRRITTTALLTLLGALGPVVSYAAGIGLNVTTAGVPLKIDNSKTFTYNVDQGPLGKLSNSKAARVVLAAIEALQGITTAKLSFEESDPLDRDVTGDNLSDFLDGVPSDVNPVIFDNDGGVTEALLGAGASLNTLSFGGVLQGTPTGKIVQGAVILNGRAFDGLFDPADVSEADMTRATEKAFLQLLNVGASDLNDELAVDGNVANNTAIPIMYPATVLGGGIAPTLDDQMAVSTLYPAANFETTTGVIRGQVTLADGTTGLQGIAVIARKVDDPINSAVEAISGSTFENDVNAGSRDPAQRGQYEIRVPPGQYTLEMRELRAGIGPLRAITPLPGGTQFYQAGGGSTAGPDPASATPVTVTAGQPTEVKLVAGGTAAPAPQNVAEVEPNDAPIDAPLLPANAVVTGNVSPKDPGMIAAYIGVNDHFEDLYRIQVTEPSIVTMLLQPKDKVDLDLYLLDGVPGGAAPTAVGASATDGTDPEATQVAVGPGTYYVVVTAWDAVSNATGTDYTLSVTTSPIGPRPERPRPVLNQLVVGDITGTSAKARWLTDVGATADVIVGMPAQEVGDPTVATTHEVALTNLTAEAYSNLVAWSQLPGASRDSIPGVYFRTGNKTPVSGPAKLDAAMIGQFQDFIPPATPGDDDQRTLLTALAIRNSGGNATNVQITGLTVTPGWKLAVPVTAPINVGQLDSGATAIVVVRLLRDGTGPDPVATVTGTGTATGADGAAATFNVGP